MPVIKNKLNSPLSIDLGDGKSLHLQPFEKRDVSEKELKSIQMQAAIRSGYVKTLPDKAPVKKKGSER